MLWRDDAGALDLRSRHFSNGAACFSIASKNSWDLVLSASIATYPNLSDVAFVHSSS